jgi:hypothetical protein
MECQVCRSFEWENEFVGHCRDRLSNFFELTTGVSPENTCRRFSDEHLCY